MVETATPLCNFGWKAPDFRLIGVGGREWSLDDIKGPKGYLIIFMCNHCPYVKSILDELIEDITTLKDHGINTVAISSNDAARYPDDSFEKMKELASNKSIAFPYLYDETQSVAKAFDAVCTPDFFGFNSEGGLQYRGRHSESRRDKVPGARRELREAMIMVANTGRGPEEQYPSLGCSIKWKD